MEEPDCAGREEGGRLSLLHLSLEPRYPECGFAAIHRYYDTQEKTENAKDLSKSVFKIS